MDEADRGNLLAAFQGEPDDPLIPVDSGHGRAPPGELAGKQPVPAPHVNRRTASIGHRVQDHPLIVNVVIPVLARLRFHP